MCRAAMIPAAVLIIISVSAFGSATPSWLNRFDLESTLQQLKKLFTAHGIVRQIMMRLIVAVKWNGVVDFVFCEHSFVGWFGVNGNLQ